MKDFVTPLHVDLTAYSAHDVVGLAGSRWSEHAMVSKRVQTLLEQLRAQGITDEHVLDALAQVPREKFVDEAFEHKAWENVALPIGQGQTISQPYMVARMTELLELTPESRVLEIGTGSGIKPRSWRIWFTMFARSSELKVYSGRRVVA
jgi:hypothetical protein